MIGSIIRALVVGAIIGVVARLVMPGRQDIGMLTTVLIGAVGGLIGSAVASQFGYHNANGGVAWITRDGHGRASGILSTAAARARI